LLFYAIVANPGLVGVPAERRLGGGPVDEARLVGRARGGDREAFGALFDRYARMVHGILLSRAPRREVDDLIQDVFVTAFEKVGSLRDDGYFSGWLATIARRRAADFHRGRRPTEPLSDELGQEDGERAEAERILRVVRELPEAYRETLVLRLVEGMTGPEIAEQVGLTKDSVRVNLHRGMSLLRERLGIVG
jgi:RNA polymerase sigma-70 factor (ECF subfamily)